MVQCVDMDIAGIIFDARRNMYRIAENTNVGCIGTFLATCFEFADSFSLTEGYRETDESKEMLKSLKPYLIKTLETEHWFSYYVTPLNKKRVHIFKACPESREILMRLYTGLFLDGVEEWVIPEDLCFFINKKMFLGTVSHEIICFLYPVDDEMALAFKGICDWEEVDDISAEQIVYD